MKPILVKYSEIALKGRNRSVFEEQLVKNIVKTTGLSEKHITRERGRIIIIPKHDSEEKMVLSQLSYVFGVHSFSRVEAAESNMDSITQTALRAVKASGRSTGTFAIDTRRADKSFSKTSSQVNNHVGRLIQDRYSDLAVDLSSPDITVFIEIREKNVYIYLSSDETSGPGGLPVGVSGFGLALLSGGIDSPVASWLMLKRGMKMDAVYFHSPPQTSEKAKEKVFDLSRVLSRWRGEEMITFVAPFAEIQKKISEKAPEGYWTVLFRRSMQRIAEGIVRQKKYGLVTTGDSLAQVASQTPENLAVVDAVSSTLTVRPLIGFDKQETVNLAKKIGLYEIAIRPYQDCCSVFTPDKPKTKSRLKDVKRAEKDCGDLVGLEKKALDNTQVFKIGSQGILEMK